MKTLQKLLTLFVLALSICSTAQAQEKVLPVLTVYGFTSATDKVPSNLASAIRSNVIGIINKTHRVRVIDADNTQALAQESERRKSEAAMADAGRVGEIGTMNANYVMNGEITGVTCTQKESSLDGHIYYSSVVTFTLKIQDAANSSILGQETFSVGGTGDTGEEAMEDLQQLPTGPIERFILNTFKIQGKVVEISDQDKGKAKKIYINLGSADGVSKDQVILVFKEVTIGGKKARRQIGEAKVEEVASDELSLCQVKKGGEFIVQCMEQQIDMPVETKEKKANFFGF